MSLHPISKFALWLKGARALPAGAVPLACENHAGLVCLMPTGRWIMWIDSVIHSRPPETQRGVMEVVVSQLGGTSAAVADRLDVSPRTVEAWRSGKAALSIKAAYQIAEKLVEEKS